MPDRNLFAPPLTAAPRPPFTGEGGGREADPLVITLPPTPPPLPGPAFDTNAVDWWRRWRLCGLAMAATISGSSLELLLERRDSAFTSTELVVVVVKEFLDEVSDSRCPILGNCNHSTFLLYWGYRFRTLLLSHLLTGPDDHDTPHGGQVGWLTPGGVFRCYCYLEVPGCSQSHVNTRAVTRVSVTVAFPILLIPCRQRQFVCLTKKRGP